MLSMKVSALFVAPCSMIATVARSGSQHLAEAVGVMGWSEKMAWF